MKLARLIDTSQQLNGELKEHTAQKSELDSQLKEKRQLTDSLKAKREELQKLLNDKENDEFKKLEELQEFKQLKIDLQEN